LVSAVLWSAVAAWGTPPTHDMSITKDGTDTIGPLSQCPAGAATSIDLAFREQFHLTFTDSTFHLTNTTTGTFTGRAADGSVVSTGHFTNTVHDQGPGFPKESFTAVINAHGRAVDGSRVSVHNLDHFTVTPDGTLTVNFEKADC